MEDRDAFDEAIYEWSEDHWLQHRWRDGAESTCLWSRVERCVSPMLWDWTALELAQVIREQYPERLPPKIGGCVSPVTDVAEFNDNPATTFGDVRTVLEKVSVRWQERI